MPELPATPDESNQDDLERLLLEEIHLQQPSPKPTSSPFARRFLGEDDEEYRNGEASLTGSHPTEGDLQGAIGLFGEAGQDMATAGVELGLGRHFACADFCNQAAEKAAQAVSLLRFGRRTTYDHDLQALGAAVGAPQGIQDDMAVLTPFHPESFYADTPPEEADEVISAEQASSYVQRARRVVRWARDLILSA